MESIDPQTGIARCGRADGPTCIVTAANGCTHFERGPGIDDDDWEPKPLPFVPETAPRARNASRDSVDGASRPRRPAPALKVVPIPVPPRDSFGGMFN